VGKEDGRASGHGGDMHLTREDALIVILTIGAGNSVKSLRRLGILKTRVASQLPEPFFSFREATAS
jgi:hypothetical protein